MRLVDTNILIYAADISPEERAKLSHEGAIRFIERLGGSAHTESCGSLNRQV